MNDDDNTLSKKKALILGFYDRGNLGDEQYKTTIPLFFGSAFTFTFVSIDDALPIKDGDYDLVICGGGDIIVGYFMKQVQDILATYNGPAYAFSVGVPYDADLPYVDLFDHIVVRSLYDYGLVSDRLGADNVTYLPDAGYLHSKAMPMVPDVLSTPSFGVALATPVLLASPDVSTTIASGIAEFMTVSSPETTATFFLFNTNARNSVEYDAIGVELVLDKLPPSIRARCNVFSAPDDSIAMVAEMRKMAFNVCMRYHSIVFSVSASTPFIVLTGTKKTQQLANDLAVPREYVLDVQELTSPSEFARTLGQRARDRATVSVPEVGRFVGNAALEVAIAERVYRRLRLQPPGEISVTVEDAVASVIEKLNVFFGSQHVTRESTMRKGVFDIIGRDPVKVARIICFAITGDYDSSCVWGLSENLLKDDFVLFEAIDFILKDFVQRMQRLNESSAPGDVCYYPSAGTGRRVMISVDPLLQGSLAPCSIKQHERNVHRAGWSYVQDHLQNFQANRFRRTPKLIVDTFIERTFHWGKESLLLTGQIPYTSKWMGFVHHTYDTSFGPYNCEALFENEVFIESLEHCVCLVALSRHLAQRLAQSLEAAGFGDRVPVRYIAHPTEFVSPSKQFSMSQFTSSQDRKVVQVGAWLRHSYAIFALPIPQKGNVSNLLNISKAALKGNNMDGYYISDERFEKIIAAINGTGIETPGPQYTCDPNPPPTMAPKDNNMYVVGMVNWLENAHRSVEIINKLSDDAYDDLLSRNMVFLYLGECSAVNSILECVVRNTVIVVNRQPAVEEVLGAGYPGLYDSLEQAAAILGSIDTLNECFIWLNGLDKSVYTIDSFIKSFVETVDDVGA